MKEKKTRADGFVITHNVTGNTIPQWVKQFEANEANRIFKRSNNVMLYHECMSFSNKTGKIPVEVLRDLATKYI